MLKLIIEVEEPPDKHNEVETFNTDKFRYTKGEYVGGTKRVRRFVVKAKTS